MSIFKESFRDYVKNQFATRQKIISSGNSDKNSDSRLLGAPQPLQPGAFYAYGSKQCVIRMASLVDLMEDIGLDLGGSRFESYKGETFARNFILEGGILSTYARNSNGEQVIREVDQVRGGFPKPTKKVNLSYGDPSIASDPSSDGYGAVPMPGIIDASIETKSAYGSLRSAKVNFSCHNLRQLEILELLYMRPGYPVLMEWGWSPYIKNDGSIENSFPSIASEDKFWDDSQISQEYIQNRVIELKKETNGNYDGFIGFVTNFNYTARPDGGFDCSTELISMGETIDSLKVPTFGFSSTFINDPSLNAKSSDTEDIYNNSLGYIISKLNQLDTEIDLEWYKDLAAYFDFIESAKDRSNQKINEAFQSLVELLGFETAKQCIIPKNKLITGGGDNNITTQYGYIRWDAFTELLNKEVIPKNEKGNPTVILSNFLDTPEPGSGTQLTPILYTKYSDYKDTIMDVSCKSQVCILPHQFKNFKDTERNLSTLNRIGLGIVGTVSSIAGIGAYIINSALGVNSELNKAQSFTESQKLFEAAVTGELDVYSSGNSIEITPEYAERRIGGIFIGVSYIDEVYKRVFSNSDATLGDFLNELWKGINDICPMHNFGLVVDHENTNVVRVIDLPISTDDLKELDPRDLFSFNIMSNDTIAREFKYDTQIPSSLKATIAINAQSGAGADDIDSVTFAAFNRSIKSRLHSTNQKFSEKEANSYFRLQDARAEREKRLQRLMRQIQIYNNGFFNNLENNGQNEELESVSSGIQGIIKEAQSLEIYLEKSSSGYLKNQSIIPINLNLVLDGISGIVIGNVFKVDESRLPKAYRKGNIAFVVLGESQNITSGQDWTTSIRGQMILLPLTSELNGKGQFRNIPGEGQTPTEVEIPNIEENTEIAEEVAPVETFTAAQQKTQDEVLAEYIDLNRRFFNKAWARDFLQTETFRTGTNIFVPQINQYNVELGVLVDEWEILRPQVEEAFGPTFFSIGSEFRRKWQEKEGNIAVVVNINGYNYQPFLEQPRLSPDIANTYLNNIFKEIGKSARNWSGNYKD